MQPRVTLLLVVALLAGLALTRHSLLASAGSPADDVVFTVAAEYEPLAWLQGRERFPLGAQIFVHGEADEYPLVPGFSASADPEISFDGTHILFSGKQ